MSRYIIVGLGNIGLRYRKTRHNVGFMAVDLIAKQNDIKVRKNMCSAAVGEGRIKDKSVVLAKPKTYMNLSGQSIRQLLDWYKSDLEKMIIIYDDMDLDFGDVRIRYKGGGGSHKGMKSILNHVGSDEFIRIRIGIGKNPYIDAVDYVLGKFPKTEKEVLDDALLITAHAVTCIIEEGIDIAMNRYNNRKDKKDKITE